MAIGSARPFRNAHYTFFIVTHVGCLLIIFVSLWIHRPQMGNWVAAGVAIYFLDRVWRTGRIILYHYIRTLPKSSACAAYVEALSPDTIRVVVRTRQSWIAGAHVYRTFATYTISLSHVLKCSTLSWRQRRWTSFLWYALPPWPAIAESNVVSSISRPLTQLDSKRPAEAQQELLIRVRNGVTKKLYDLAMSASTDEEAQKGLKWPRAKLPLCWTEGPCESCRLSNMYLLTFAVDGNLQHLGEEFQTVLLVAGGSGLTFTFPLMLDIVRRAHSMDLGHAEVAVATERLTFVWIIRDIGEHSSKLPL